MSFTNIGVKDVTILLYSARNSLFLLYVFPSFLYNSCYSPHLYIPTVKRWTSDGQITSDGYLQDRRTLAYVRRSLLALGNNTYVRRLSCWPSEICLCPTVELVAVGHKVFYSPQAPRAVSFRVFLSAARCSLPSPPPTHAAPVPTRRRRPRVPACRRRRQRRPRMPAAAFAHACRPRRRPCPPPPPSG